MNADKFRMPAANVTVVVEFEKIIYNITVDANEGGTVEVQKTASFEDIVRLAITPATGYKVVQAELQYQGKNGSVITDLMNADKFRMPAADVTVVVEFVRLTTPVKPEAASYEVKHYIQKLDGEYELVETKTYVGKLGTTIAVADHVQSKTGYHLNIGKSTPVVVEEPKTDNGELVLTTLNLYYDLDEYYITVAEYDGVTVVVPESAKYTEEVAYTITAKEGFELVSAKMVCGDEKTDLEASGTFKMPAGDVEIVVEYVRLTTPIEPIEPVKPTVPSKPNWGSGIKDFFDKLFDRDDSSCKPTEPEATEPEETVPTTPTEPEETVPTTPAEPEETVPSTPVKPSWNKWLYRVFTWWK